MDASEVTAITAAGASLATAIGVLFRRTVDLGDSQAELNREIGELKGKQDGIRDLSVQVLQVVHDATAKDETTE